MGAQPSKPAETKVYVPETPVNFESKLIAQIDNSTETDFTRTQKAERYLQEKVSAKLADLEAEALKEFESKLSSSTLPDDFNSNSSTNTLSTALVNEKVEQLKNRLAKLEESHKAKSTESVVATKKSLTECLLKNKEKPLNCYDEVEQFKKAVMEIWMAARLKKRKKKIQLLYHNMNIGYSCGRYNRAAVPLARIYMHVSRYTYMY